MKKLLLFLVLSLILIPNAFSQFRNYKVKGGIQYQQLLPFTEYSPSTSFLGRAFLGFEIANGVSIDIGGGYGKYKTDDDFNEHTHSQTTDPNHTHYVKTDIIPFDVRVRFTPFPGKSWNPYFYVGSGFTHYIVKEVESQPNLTEGQKPNTWTMHIPAGIGTEVKLGKNVLLDLSANAAYFMTDQLNDFVLGSWEDAYGSLGLGLTFTGNNTDMLDNDKDGLINMREDELGTNPDNPDTDGDGLKDGPEVDQYRTNPLNKDTDGDTLTDGDEVLRYSTNPLDKDTDADRLADNEEINNYRTLPNDNDTDDDDLKDGDEVLTHKTDPLNRDTDAGSVADGIEVGRGSNPLNPDDDLPTVAPPPISVGTVIVLDGINFASGSAEIEAGSEDILEKAYISMRDNPDIVVEISGHTDSRGGREMNMNLSKNRAESVKAYLVSKGISSDRIETVGYGPDQPVASNDTEEGRLKNRRIEFKRIK